MHFNWLGPELLVCCLAHRGPTGVSFAPELVEYSAPRGLHRRAAYSICESWFLFIRMFIVIYLFVIDDSLTS